MSTTNLLNLPFVKNNKDKIHWGNLVGSALSLAVSEAVDKAAGPTLLVVPDTPTALKIEQELAFFKQPNDYDVFVFPDWETLPYDSFSPHQDIISQRLQTLYNLPKLKSGVVIVPISTVIQRIAPKAYINANSLVVKNGDKFDPFQLRNDLESAGYHSVDQVMEHGEYSLRGSIFDIFPMGSTTPIRLDLFDDEVDSIRIFDIETQRSGNKLDKVELLPGSEFPTDEDAIERFRTKYRELFKLSNEKESIYQQVSKGNMPAGIEYYLPLFFDNVATIFDYLPNNTLLLTLGDLEGATDQAWKDISFRYEDRRYDVTRPLLEPTSIFLPKEELFSHFKTYPRITLSIAELTKAAGRTNIDAATIPDIAINNQSKTPYKSLQDFIVSIKEQRGRVLFSVESAGRRETVSELLAKADIRPQEFQHLSAFLDAQTSVGLVVGTAENSVIFNPHHKTQPPVVLITETELLGHRVSQRRRRRKHEKETSADAIVRNLAELKVGQPIVHIDHGVGRYLGLETIDAGGTQTEFLSIQYANDAKLFVPVSSLELISRYSGGEQESAPLHKLGSDAWEKAKKRAAERVRDVAAELLDIYAQREAKPGYAYKIDKEQYVQFANGFPFEETVDQVDAIESVIQDMTKANAMDRLVCGDVGFGKTEVAMRAAFVAVNDGKQVACLVPTTLLAQQHYENFKDRFANWPIKVEVLSRFKTPKEQKAVLEELNNGRVDIVIGTHKLLQEDIKFADLGLLIVDEEHRFGVRQKEKIKALRADVDILTLTATPIPRTLNMAMSGMRDLSIIATPPAKRLSVKTFVRQKDNALIREAILREIKRGGQVYFLHNNVDTIEETAQAIATLVPEATVTTAHGQMREKELERIMSDFYHQRFNVIVCTTIIETGIDVPTANTIIMDRADHLGLAQMHQLRGRVGRSHHQAYAYLLTPHEKRMTKDAIKRLEAIENLEDLGAGFALATHDLEIRGAGELLGDEQSGQIASVGYTLYMDMLEQAVHALKEGKEPTLDHLIRKQSEVELRIPALLPDDYIHDVNIRLSLYKKIASCTSTEQLDDVQVELIDRFGLLPDAAKNLIKITEFKMITEKLGISKLEAGPKGGVIEFTQNTKVDPSFIISLIQTQPQIYRMEGPTRLKFNIEAKDTKERVKLINAILNDLHERQVAA
ncbi:transcription-repair coupling factor [Flocculibacter collagenilyticus]|uniref:transcription-repair coupling factor n=1 Tax=Flocculibacter collagenilyticus TaxID=2744479 RepID=UPI0018F74C91|nr:transcription-repair coupling factor [Flocculibacter collagenilyticus]